MKNIKGMLSMKKQLNENWKVVTRDHFEDVVNNKKLPYPFDKDLINLLKNENKFKQEYYYIENGNDYAFFVMYRMKMNIFTFSKLKLYFNLKVVGFPCSLSNSGYVTNNEKLLLDYLKTIKGAKLVLNVKNPIRVEGITIGETLPTCVFENKFRSITEYVESLRSSYRRRIIKAVEACENIEVKEILNDSVDVYDLYFNTYQKSDYKLEKLEKGFFENVDATKLVFLKKGNPIGFVLLKKVESKLIFMLCGMDYSYDTTDLYYYMLYKIIEYAIKNNCTTIDFGQTSEETKLKFGALLEKRYFYAHHSNKFLNFIVSKCKNVLEYKYGFPEYRVFKEKK